MAIELPPILGKFKIDRTDLKSLGSDARSSMREAENAVESSAGKMGKSLSGFQKAAGVAFAAAGVGAGAAFVQSLDIGAAQDKLSAQLGASGQWSEDLGKIAGDLYANAYGESLGEVNNAIKGVIQNGLVFEDASKEQIEAVTVKVLDLATAFEQDLGGTTKAVGQLIKTGLAKDATEALDLVTRGFQQGLDRSGDFLDTLNEYGTQFRKLGLDGAQAMGLISQGLRGGARDADVVADAIKEFSIRAVDGSELTAESFTKLGLNAEKMTATIAKGGPDAANALDQVLDKLRGVEDPALRAQIAVGLFGTQSEDLGEALFKLDLSKAAGEMGDVAGAADKMGETLNDNAKVKLETFKRGMEQNVQETLGKVVSVIDKFPGPVQDVTQAVAGFAGSLGPAVILLPQMGSGIASIAHKVPDMIDGIKKLWTLLSANPISLVIIAIAALAAGLIYAYNHSETFRRIVDESFAAVKVIVASAVDGIIGFLQTMVKFWFEAADQVLKNAELMFSWIPGVGDKLAEARTKFDQFRDNVEGNLERAKAASESWKNKTIGDFVKVSDGLQRLPEVKSIEITAVDNASAKIQAIDRMLDGITSKTVYVDTIRRDSTAGFGRGPVHAGGPIYHGGGHVQSFHGGGLKGDEVSAKLQVGEFVLQRSAVKALGISNLQRLNSAGGQAAVGNTYNVAVNLNGWVDFTKKDVATRQMTAVLRDAIAGIETAGH